MYTAYHRGFAKRVEGCRNPKKYHEKARAGEIRVRVCAFKGSPLCEIGGFRFVYHRSCHPERRRRKIASPGEKAGRLRRYGLKIAVIPRAVGPWESPEVCGMFGGLPHHLSALVRNDILGVTFQEVCNCAKTGSFPPAFHTRPFGPPSPGEKAGRLRRYGLKIAVIPRAVGPWESPEVCGMFGGLPHHLSALARNDILGVTFQEVCDCAKIGSFPPAFHIRPFGPPSPREKAGRLRRFGPRNELPEVGK